MDAFLGIDCGSVTIKAALLNDDEKLIDGFYFWTEGEPVHKLKTILSIIKKKYGKIKIIRAGVTGSGRKIIGIVMGSYAVKNEIICHSYATIKEFPDVRTIIDIGGQDSKFISIKKQIVNDFAMNTLCAAGTGSFLEHQSSRLNILIEDFGKYALKADKELNISGRCTVFAESDMISLQQIGESKNNIIYGLCLALARNFINNIARGKEFHKPIFFQGGVAANEGMIKAFQHVLGKKTTVPKNFKIMGAIGAALIGKRHYSGVLFRGFDIISNNYAFFSHVCMDCDNQCHIVGIKDEARVLGYMGGRCGKWL
jgi:predicted CoA-substrate-specific enzyme activase